MISSAPAPRCRSSTRYVFEPRGGRLPRVSDKCEACKGADSGSATSQRARQRSSCLHSPAPVLEPVLLCRSLSTLKILDGGRTVQGGSRRQKEPWALTLGCRLQSRGLPLSQTPDAPVPTPHKTV
ncbi:unnamed protein product [Prorocentrum cordatum]|uniref:Uncharacterized protein n=1 Tax=Prorocentrum cordatum TaxID=2364126 RepID=A0ABN9TN64_9DINO|nr:unnamed protein product [Polarella glacialis]